jgi:hypothetical protein
VTGDLKALLMRFAFANPGCEQWSRVDFLARFRQWAGDHVGELSDADLSAIAIAEASEVTAAQDVIGVAVAKIAAARAQLIDAGVPEDAVDAEIARRMRQTLEE